jgi:16S rRNA (guanine527-N7)-methyltransferase
VIDQIAAAAKRNVSRETFTRIEKYVELLRREAVRQNLISASTIESIWDRHILDSAQLVQFEPKAGSAWVDIGSGAGLPGLVVACLVDGPVALVVPRRLRAEFLQRAIVALNLSSHVSVQQVNAQRAHGKYDVISARAVASLSKLFEISQHLSTGNTVWALPKGRGALGELAEAQQAWQGVFHVERSVTDSESYIVVGTGVGVKPR